MNLKAVILALAAVLAVACSQPSTATAQSAAAAPNLPRAGNYHLDSEHFAVMFRTNHMGLSHTIGRFNAVQAELTLDPAVPERSRLSATARVDSVNTGLASFDQYLTGRFFNAAATPEIRFQSTSIERTGPATARVIGDLTMNGQTHALTLEVTLNGAQPSPLNGRYTAGFSAIGSISRGQFGLNAYPQFVADSVEITIEAEFEQQPG